MGAAEEARGAAMISQDEAFTLLDAALSDETLASETLDVALAQTRVLAKDAPSQLDLPSFDKSAMDGFAVLSGDHRDAYRVVGLTRAGDPPASAFSPGEAIKIMTGAPLAAGAGRVIKIEDTQAEGDLIRILRHDGMTHVRKQGEDLARGDRVLKAGTRLGSLEVANLVACGVVQVEVCRRPRVVVLSTGDELVDDPAALGPGKIMDSNGPMLRGLCAAYGIDLAGTGRVPDDPERTRARLDEALSAADLVVLSGGVSMGEFDYVLEALAALGLSIHFSRVAIKPGKPTVFASGRGKAVFALPGNPVSSFVMFHLFVLRAVAHLTGMPVGWRELQLRLAEPFSRRKATRLLYMPCRLTPEGACEPVHNNGSGHLAALLGADGFIQVPEGISELPAGAMVTFSPFPSVL